MRLHPWLALTLCTLAAVPPAAAEDAATLFAKHQQVCQRYGGDPKLAALLASCVTLREAPEAARDEVGFLHDEQCRRIDAQCAAADETYRNRLASIAIELSCGPLSAKCGKNVAYPGLTYDICNGRMGVLRFQIHRGNRFFAQIGFSDGGLYSLNEELASLDGTAPPSIEFHQTVDVAPRPGAAVDGTALYEQRLRDFLNASCEAILAASPGPASIVDTIGGLLRRSAKCDLADVICIQQKAAEDRRNRGKPNPGPGIRG